MARPEDAWYFREDIVSTYESWYEGKGKRADILEKELLQWLLSRHESVENLLEIGCGTAHFTRWFESLRIKSVGLDLSPLMLREAKRLWRGDLVRGNSVHLPFRRASFDLVAFITCMEYMPDPVAVLKEARRVARKGVVWGIMNKWSAPTIRRKIQVLLGRNPFYKNAHFFSVLEAKKLLHDAFADEDHEISWKATVFPRLVPMRHSTLPFGAFLGISVRFIG